SSPKITGRANASWATACATGPPPVSRLSGRGPAHSRTSCRGSAVGVPGSSEGAPASASAVGGSPGAWVGAPRPPRHAASVSDSRKTSSRSSTRRFFNIPPCTIPDGKPETLWLPAQPLAVLALVVLAELAALDLAPPPLILDIPFNRRLKRL